MEQVTGSKWNCSNCGKKINDENEYIDNKGVCDDCYSIPVRKRRGLLIHPSTSNQNRQ